ncbi:putative NBD/HSP70 family sugar kinase [Enterococcus sp. PF1-24]|uniref:ROK family protein n=1 Tax=unclassified Enterococcus TaxID=2608891 RepID=UPI0024770E95|nr:MULTISPECIES: ROK family protein [unclassified Enterococcus]MDH6365332.1 putative NBD/HSP70 family sugar kinase [Enterococcus sp. PFB1-1]MDH6402412.1 putative NBD/HSP70 family sugar kinase [Enterococcus sp. PF1-24]
MKQTISQIVNKTKINYEVEGLAISAPGLVNDELGTIGGISAIPYIHTCDFKEELQKITKLRVAMENDANCAALAEFWKGAAKDSNDAVFFVIGTGIGGAIILNGQLVKGKNLFGGEFGYTFLNERGTLSELGSSVKTVERYNKLTGKPISGEEFFGYSTDNLLAVHLSQNFYQAVARGIYNLLVSLDPGRIIIGGGVSNNQKIISEIKRHVEMLILDRGIKDMKYEIIPCEYKNSANLIGAVYNFLNV